MTEAVGARHASPSLLYAQCRGLLIPPGRGMPRPYFCISPFRHSHAPQATLHLWPLPCASRQESRHPVFYWARRTRLKLP